MHRRTFLSSACGSLAAWPLARMIQDETASPAKPTLLVTDPPDAQSNYNALRISTHVFNDEARLDRAVDALARIPG